MTVLSGDPLPRNWAKTRLRDVVRPIRVKVRPADFPDVQFIGMEHIEAHTTRLLATVPASTMKSSAAQFKTGDILYGRLRPYLNKVYVPEFEGLCSAEFIVLTPHAGVDARLVQYLLNSAPFVSFSSGLNTGDRPRVDFDGIGEYQVAIPPSVEQRRIVEAIETQFTRLDAAVVALERVRANLKRYRASVLRSAVEGRLVPTEAELARKEGRDYEPASVLLDRILAERRRRWEEAELARMKAAGKRPKDARWKSKYKEPVAPDTSALPQLPEGWCWATIDQLAGDFPNSLTDGPFGSNLKTAHYREQGPRVVRLQNIGDGEFVDAEAHISEDHFQRLEKHAVFAGDIVISSLGEILPKACMIPDWLGRAIVKADCIRFAPDLNLARADYLVHALNSEPIRKRTRIHGMGRPRIGLTVLRGLPLPLPPISEQARISAEISRALSFAANAHDTIEHQLERIWRLRQAILKWAFKGKLVDQDPNDEPASVLLERIRAERAAATSSGKSRKTNTHQIEAAK